MQCNVSVTPLVFQADDVMACYYLKALKHLAEACPPKRNTNGPQ